MNKRNIGTTVHLIPLHIHPYYTESYGYAGEDFPIAFNEYQGLVSLPIYTRKVSQDVENGIDAVVDIVKGYRRH